MITQTAFIRAYLRQTENYFSESHEELKPIRTMNPIHALNAASKMLREAKHWAAEAGLTPRQSDVWMTSQPLFQALRDQGGY